MDSGMTLALVMFFFGATVGGLVAFVVTLLSLKPWKTSDESCCENDLRDDMALMCNMQELACHGASPEVKDSAKRILMTVLHDYEENMGLELPKEDVPAPVATEEKKEE